MSLIHCIYTSAADTDLGPEALPQLLAAARARNARTGVTGLLLRIEHSFFQVLEGDSEIVDELFLRIAGDPRHYEVTEIFREPIARRAFGGWTMGFAAPAREHLDAALGLNEFLGDRPTLHGVGRERAKKLLQAFATGRQRQRYGMVNGRPRTHSRALA